MRIVLHRGVPDDPELHRQWNSLVLQMERQEVFYTYEWALAIQTGFRATLKPFLLLGYDVDALVGVAPLAADSDEENVGFLAATTGDYCDFLSAPQRRAEFVAAVFADLHQRNISSLVLANLPEDSATLAAVRSAAKKYGFHVHARLAYLCPQIELDSAAKREELKTTVMGKRQFRRCMKALEREGPVTISYLRSRAPIESALPEFVEAHVARYRAAHRVSILSTPERRLFLAELARRFGESGVLTLSTLRIGQRPVAWSYGFQFHGAWFLYQTTFDTRWEENSPGYCLLAKIIIEACDNGALSRVDLGLGTEGYKNWFANTAYRTLHVTATKSLNRHLQGIARYRAASLLKRSPSVESAIRNVLGRLR